MRESTCVYLFFFFLLYLTHMQNLCLPSSPQFPKTYFTGLCHERKLVCWLTSQLVASEKKREKSGWFSSRSEQSLSHYFPVEYNDLT